MINTSTKEYRRRFEEYVYDNVHECVNELSHEEQLNFIFSEFNRVANYPSNIHNYPNKIDRFADYLQGLPFDFVAWKDCRILEDIKELHSVDSIPEAKHLAYCNNYYNHLAIMLDRMRG